MGTRKFKRVGVLINCGIIKELSRLWDYMSKEDLAHNLGIETLALEKLLEDPGEITYEYIIEIGNILHCDASLLCNMILDYWERKFDNSAYYN
jgi:plasmid maintenance system antidote protein VapI